MKSLKYALLAVTLLVSGGLMAETKAQVAKRKAAAAKLKEHEKKYKKHKTEHKTEKAAYTKKPVKHETKKVTHSRTTKAVTTTPATTKTTAKPQEKSYFSQVTDALGWTGGTTGAAATTAATTAAVAGTVHHRGPEGFYEHHKMPYHWKHGWTGGYYNGEWQFAGHNLKWWHDNYPSYYKDVVRPEATKAGITERQHFAHEGTGFTKRK